jgi:hypothetical protein
VLRGPEPKGWELVFQPLTANDVRGLSEKAVSQQEIDKRYRAIELTQALNHVAQQDKGGVVEEEDVDGLDVVDEKADEEAGRVPIEPHGASELADAVAPGEGRRTIPWIWVAGLSIDKKSNVQLSDGT